MAAGPGHKPQTGSPGICKFEIDSSPEMFGVKRYPVASLTIPWVFELDGTFEAEKIVAKGNENRRMQRIPEVQTLRWSSVYPMHPACSKFFKAARRWVFEVRKGHLS